MNLVLVKRLVVETGEHIAMLGVKVLSEERQRLHGLGGLLGFFFRPLLGQAGKAVMTKFNKFLLVVLDFIGPDVAFYFWLSSKLL